jgi:amidase
MADHGAFVAGMPVRVAPTGSGLLDGLRLAVKDNIDIAGTVTGAGNPDWRASHRPAAVSAPCVTALLAAGGTLVGKTVSDELAFSLEGRNAFDGTPINPACPEGLPGGSSSGSAVAVAAGLADAALGTDTGGSVRVPASFCGVYGFRPTHGRVPLDGVVPLAPSYDTVGWFARSAGVLDRVGLVLLGEPSPGDTVPVQWLAAMDAFALSQSGASLLAAAPKLGSLDACSLFDGEEDLWRECYRVVQGAEIWAAHGAWIRRDRPKFADDIAARFDDAAGITEAEVTQMMSVRRRIADRLRSQIAPGTVLVLPTTPGHALSRSAGPAEIGAFYTAGLALTAAAGHAGLPQISLPGVSDLDGFPIGLSLIGWAGGDHALLRLAAVWE